MCNTVIVFSRLLLVVQKSDFRYFQASLFEVFQGKVHMLESTVTQVKSYLPLIILQYSYLQAVKSKYSES